MIEYHPCSEIFPMMREHEFNFLKENILQEGLLEPIVLYQDKILDGRNRYRACLDTGVEPEFISYEGNNPLSYSISLNLHRRHLTSGQRAILAVEIMGMFEEEAKQNQRNAGIKFGRGKKNREQLTQKIDEPILKPNERTSAHRAAQMLRTNRAYVHVAKKIMSSPTLFQEVKSGNMSLVEAIKIHTRENKVKPSPLSGKYSVIYADPPWGFSTATNAQKMVNNHYPTMNQEQLLALAPKVKRISEKECVLFLWTINSHLKDAIHLIEEWGFTYRSSIVWRKNKGNQGRSGFRIFHELLLIGWKGKPDHEPAVWFPSIIEHKTLGHSVKPPIFRKMIEDLYPDVQRLEMFSRQSNVGWISWGNEAL